jgi:putative SOS response-associated peptidase YedK
MCYNVAYIEKRGEKYAARYKNAMGVQQELKLETQELPTNYFFSGFTHPKLPLVKYDGIGLYSWGLIPAWIKDEKNAFEIRTKTLNAMGETVFEKPSFRKSMAAQRGLLGVFGFYEWRDVHKVKYPYFIRAKGQEFTSLACIYEDWNNPETGQTHSTFSIITTAANPLMEKIHNVKMRMPLILSPEDEAAWLNPELNQEKVKQLIRPFDEIKMEAYPVSQMLNNPRNNRNVPEAILPVDYPSLAMFD